MKISKKLMPMIVLYSAALWHLSIRQSLILLLLLLHLTKLGTHANGD